MNCAPPLEAGSWIGPGYAVEKHLHRSNVLDVYDAWDDERACRCVVKTLRPDRLWDADARRALLAEGALLQRMTHPGIVRGYATPRRPRPVVAMETLTGETLAHLVDRRERPLGARELAFLGLQLSSAVGYLHRHGVLHLDLKPSNIVAEAGRAKLIDLSIAQAPGRVAAGTGTWCYLAPEQARGGPVGPAADVWGIGVVLWEAACGDTPFADEALEYPQLERRAPALESMRRLPALLAAAVDRCLDPDPVRRPGIAELRDALTTLAGARG
jgi:eukaryotic-like serine/threonine-protein kinase